jgi:hypothetical protein
MTSVMGDGNWESQMAVERADALLSGPKREDEHPKSTSMRDKMRQSCRA